MVTWDVNSVGNAETMEMVKQEGNRAYAYTVDLASKEAIYRAAEQTSKEVKHSLFLHHLIEGINPLRHLGLRIFDM